MSRITTLIVADAKTSDAETKALLAGLPTQDVHVAMLVAGPVANIPIYAVPAAPYGSIAIPDIWHDEYKRIGKELAARADGFEQLLMDAEIEGDVSLAYCERALLESEVAKRARMSDFVFVPRALAENEDFHRIMRGLLFGSPAGVVLNAKSIADTFAAKKIIVAWDRSLPATRAVHKALPILQQADDVTIAVFDPLMRKGSHDGDPGVDLAAWLSRHGCKVKINQYPGGGREIGEAIADKAFELGADLVVMGGYTHSRMRELWFGGTTQTMIEQVKLPVLLAH
ncbi:MAG: universal stress protein [Silicimonas sp.]|nr:universal stress protein [Silicimonas sp.]